MTVSEALKNGWRELEQEESRLSGMYDRRILAESGKTVILSISRPAGMRSLYFVASQRSLRQWREVQTRGFNVRIEVGPRPSKPTARIELSSEGFGELFDQLCVEVVSDYVGHPSEEHGADAAWQRISHWLRFFEKTNGGNLSISEQVGLFGELTFLRLCLEKNIPAGRVVSAWQGPSGAAQDFSFDGTSIEVKTTTVSTDTAVKISNISQLDDAGLVALYLVHLSFERREGFGESLPQLIEEITKLIGANLRDKFFSGLLASGYSAVHAHIYVASGYRARSSRYFSVKDGFPRITQSQIDPAVFDVTYSVELAAASTHLVTEEHCFRGIGN